MKKTRTDSNDDNQDGQLLGPIKFTDEHGIYILKYTYIQTFRSGFLFYSGDQSVIGVKVAVARARPECLVWMRFRHSGRGRVTATEK